MKYKNISSVLVYNALLKLNYIYFNISVLKRNYVIFKVHINISISPHTDHVHYTVFTWHRNRQNNIQSTLNLEIFGFRMSSLQ